MRQMERMWSQKELYPPGIPDDVKDLLEKVLTGEFDDEKRAYVRRALKLSERDALRARSRSLEPYVLKPKEGEIEVVVMAMSLGMGTKSETEKETLLRVSHYAEILADTPLWAIKRACDRFEMGSVTAEELRDRSFSRGMVPKTSHLYPVASAIARPIFHEKIRIHRMLNGVVQRNGPATPENKQAVEASLQRFKSVVGGDSVLEQAKRELMSQEVGRRSLEAAERTRIAEFHNAGLDPPPATPGAPPVSLTMMLKLGYQIIEHPEGGRTLVSPGGKRRAEL